MPVTWSEAEGEHKDGAHWLLPLESVSVGPKMCAKLQAGPQALDKQIGLSQKDWALSSWLPLC